MANAYPEIGRMLRYSEEKNDTAAESAKMRAVSIVDNILNCSDVPRAGREEWYAVKNLILGYKNLDSKAREVLRSFAEPFSLKFIYEYTHGN